MAPKHLDGDARRRRRPAAAVVRPTRWLYHAAARHRRRWRRRSRASVLRMRPSSMPPIRFAQEHQQQHRVDVGRDRRAERQAPEAHQIEFSHRFSPRFTAMVTRLTMTRRARFPQRVETRRGDLHDRIAHDAGRVAGERRRPSSPWTRRRTPRARRSARRSAAPAPSGRRSRARTARASAGWPRTPSPSSRRERRSAACRARSGIVAVATDTPKIPIGRYISRNAYRSAAGTPSTAVASDVLTSRLICAAATPIVPGPIRKSTSRNAGSRGSRTTGADSPRAAAPATARASARRRRPACPTDSAITGSMPIA